MWTAAETIMKNAAYRLFTVFVSFLSAFGSSLHSSSALLPGFSASFPLVASLPVFGASLPSPSAFLSGFPTSLPSSVLFSCLWSLLPSRKSMCVCRLWTNEIHHLKYFQSKSTWKRCSGRNLPKTMDPGTDYIHVYSYLEYHSVCPLVRIGTPHPLSLYSHFLTPLYHIHLILLPKPYSLH